MEKFYNRKIIINKEQNQLRLDQALAKLSNFTRSQIKILLLNENVETESKIIKDASYRVKEGEKYMLKLIIPIEQKFEAENIPLHIVFEDHHIVL